MDVDRPVRRSPCAGINSAPQSVSTWKLNG